MSEKVFDIYIATPYAKQSLAGRAYAFAQVNRISAHLARNKYKVISPMSHWHCAARDYKLPNTWAFWKDYDLAILKASRVLLVIGDYNESEGCCAELEFAMQEKIPHVIIPSLMEGNDYILKEVIEIMTKLRDKK